MLITWSICGRKKTNFCFRSIKPHAHNPIPKLLQPTRILNFYSFIKFFLVNSTSVNDQRKIILILWIPWNQIMKLSKKTPGNFENMLKPTADLKSKHYPLKWKTLKQHWTKVYFGSQIIRSICWVQTRSYLNNRTRICFLTKYSVIIIWWFRVRVSCFPSLCIDN